MPIDSFTVLLFGLFVKLVIGALFLAFWLREREAVWFAWWSATLLLGGITAVLFMLRGAADDFITIGFGNAALVAGFACCWQGARVFGRRPPLWRPVLVAPALWLAACGVPTFMGNVSYRIVVSSILVAPFLVMSALEFWRGRQERLPSRWPIILIFASFALFFLLRIPLIGVLPFPFGALPMQPGWLGAFNLIMFAHTLLLVVLVVAISKERLELEQRTKAQTDPLTGALNRRALMLRGERLVTRHRHNGAPLCVVILDLDHFKSLNDRFGHSGGDDVLTKFVALVNTCIRPTDFLFRLGGEEFCCLLPYTGSEQARLVAERIRHQFEAAVVDIAGTPARVTVSIGIASAETSGYDLDALIRRADMAVYAAKRQGRNRVVMASVDEAGAADAGPAIAGHGIAKAS